MLIYIIIDARED
jgi:Arc/MetJ family transcription regulator